VVNNGLAPPNSANVFDQVLVGPPGTTLRIFAQNVGCDVGIEDPCLSPGAPTTIEIVEGAQIGYVSTKETSRVLVSGGWVFDNAGENLVTRDASSAVIQGGLVQRLSARESSTVSVESGAAQFIKAFDTAIIHISGGSVGATYGVPGIQALDESVIYIMGTQFEVDYEPVPYGPLVATSGLISGILASGDIISPDSVVEFLQGHEAGSACVSPDAGVPCTGTIVLVPPAAEVPGLIRPALCSLSVVIGSFGMLALRRWPELVGVGGRRVKWST
jgi:hypothetical protein